MEALTFSSSPVRLQRERLSAKPRAAIVSVSVHEGDFHSRRQQVLELFEASDDTGVSSQG